MNTLYHPQEWWTMPTPAASTAPMRFLTSGSICSSPSGTLTPRSGSPAPRPGSSGRRNRGNFKCCHPWKYRFLHITVKHDVLGIIVQSLKVQLLKVFSIKSCLKFQKLESTISSVTNKVHQLYCLEMFCIMYINKACIVCYVTLPFLISY